MGGGCFSGGKWVSMVLSGRGVPRASRGGHSDPTWTDSGFEACWLCSLHSHAGKVIFCVESLSSRDCKPGGSMLGSFCFLGKESAWDAGT